MDWAKHRRLSERWQRDSLAYVAAINGFVERGERDGWEAAGEQPHDTRGDLAKKVLAVVREANAEGAWRELRAHFAPAHEPFVPLLGDCAIDISDPLWVDDDRVVARIGPTWEPIAIGIFGRDGTSELLAGVHAVGRSPDRRFFGVVTDRGIEIRDGIAGKVVRRLQHPAAVEGAHLLAVHVLPGGEGALVVRRDGLFMARARNVTRLFPDAAALDELANDPDGGTPEYDMMHAAISPDGQLIACGHQSSQHLVMRPSGEYLGWFGPLHSSYPHHAAFSPDGSRAIFNSCHFYNGTTIGVPTHELANIRIAEWTEDPRLTTIERGARVYASAFHDGAALLGDAHGTVRATGEHPWRHFAGSTVGGLDISPAGNRLVITTAAGYLQFVDLAQPAPDPFQIGSGNHHERLRFVYWKGTPLLRW